MTALAIDAIVDGTIARVTEGVMSLGMLPLFLAVGIFLARVFIGAGPRP